MLTDRCSMKVVRKLPNFKIFLPLLGLLLGASCNPTEIKGKTAKSSVVTNDGSFDNKAFVYRDSPYIIAGPRYSPNNPDISTIVDKQKAELITTNTQLTGNC